MKIKVSKPVQVGTVDTFSIFNITRPSYVDKNTNKDTQMDMIRITFERESDKSKFSHDFRMSCWVDPRKVYADSDLNGEANPKEEEAAGKRLVKMIEKYNKLVEDYDALMAKDEVPAKEAEALYLKITKIQKDLPFTMIEWEQLQEHLANFCSVLNVDLDNLDYDPRLLEPKFSFKKDRNGDDVRVTGTGGKPTDYVGTKFENVRPMLLNYEFAGYNDIFDFVSEELVGKPFKMVVGGNFSYKDSQLYAGLPSPRSTYITAVDSPTELKYDPNRHNVGEPASAKLNKSTNNSSSTEATESDDLPF